MPRSKNPFKTKLKRKVRHATQIPNLKRKVARTTGIPTTKRGRQQKVNRVLKQEAAKSSTMSILGWIIFIAVIVGIVASR